MQPIVQANSDNYSSRTRNGIIPLNHMAWGWGRGCSPKENAGFRSGKRLVDGQSKATGDLWWLFPYNIKTTFNFVCMTQNKRVARVTFLWNTLLLTVFAQNWLNILCYMNLASVITSCYSLSYGSSQSTLLMQEHMILNLNTSSPPTFWFFTSVP